jgi:hypothetical protein
MGLKKWLGRLTGSNEKPVYRDTDARNRNIREYQLFLGDYTRVYGKEVVTAEFVATAENAPSFRLWLVGRDRGVKDAYASLPPELKAKYQPILRQEARVESLPEVYRAIKEGRVPHEAAMGMLGFESMPAFVQVIQAIDGLVNENATLIRNIQERQTKEAEAAAIQPKKTRKKRGPNKSPMTLTEADENEELDGGQV